MTNQPKPKWILGKPETHRGNHTLHVKVEASKLKKQATEVGAKPTLADVVHGTPAGQKAVDKAIKESHEVMQSMTPNQDNNFKQELRNKISSSLYGMYYYELPDNMSEAKEIVKRAASAAQSSLEEAVRLARVDENQRRLDKINEWQNRKPVPGEITTASFGSAGGAMEVAGFKRSFEERIQELQNANNN